MGFKSIIVLGHDKYYHDLDLDLQVNGGLKLHLMYPMNRSWLWNLKMLVLRVLQELWFIVKNFLNKACEYVDLSAILICSHKRQPILDMFPSTSINNNGV